MYTPLSVCEEKTIYHSYLSTCVLIASEQKNTELVKPLAIYNIYILKG